LLLRGNGSRQFRQGPQGLPSRDAGAQKGRCQRRRAAPGQDHLKGNLLLSLESSSSRMNRLAKQEMRFGTFHSIEEMLEDIDRVRPDAVEALIHRVLDEEQMALVTLGPVDRRNLPREMVA